MIYKTNRKGFNKYKNYLSFKIGNGITTISQFIFKGDRENNFYGLSKMGKLGLSLMLIAMANEENVTIEELVKMMTSEQL